MYNHRTPSSAAYRLVEESFPILDTEFDIDSIVDAPVLSNAAAHGVPHDDLAWDEQLDEGHEVSV